MPQRHRSKYRSREGQLAERYGIRRDQVARFLELTDTIYRRLVTMGVPTASKAYARQLAKRALELNV